MTAQQGSTRARTIDAIIIGAGFGGLYSLHLLREAGLSARVYDAADGVGGTWRYNNYPGARVDFPGGPYYCYTFSQELVNEWDWADTQPDQKSVLAYLDYVADKFDLRTDIQLQTRVERAAFDEANDRWTIETNHGERVTASYLICAVGNLSAPYLPDIAGIKSFAGECYHTGLWPAEPVSFAGKRVGVIGTGSSAVQAIPIIAETADQLTVFQRTPQYTLPAGTRPLDPEFIRQNRANWPQLRQQMINSPFGTPFVPPTRSALEDSPEQRQATYEAYWQQGGLGIAFNSYYDLLTDQEANETLAEFVRGKIRTTVKDQAVARKLLPDYILGTKRQILDTGYYATYNRDNVTLVDLREDPFQQFDATGVSTESGYHPLDMLVMATGYDAVTGALLKLNPVGRGGNTLKEAWKERFATYLGMMIPGYPNLFMIHGPESPCVLFNMPLGAELEAEWIRDCIVSLREKSQQTIEPASGAADSWGQEVADVASQTLFPLTDSWYNGSNIPGKHRQFAVHVGGADYFKRLTQVAENGYEGLVITG